MIEVRVGENSTEWNEFIVERGGHPLQLWGWGEVKSHHNWQVRRLYVQEGSEVIGAAQILIRPLPWPLRSLAYIPRGPVADQAKREIVLEALANYVRTKLGSVVLTVEPHWREFPVINGWQKATNTILIPQTLILDLHKSAAELLACMSKKTRQYIRKSDNEDLVIRQVKTRDELAKCLKVYRDTAARAGFALHDDDYYYDVFEKLGDHSPVFASYEGDVPVAFLWLAISQAVAFELYGGMTELGQELRANYALKWYAITTMQQWGIDEYDMNGLVSDGVSTFKRGFADHEDELAGTYDKPLSPLYPLWNKGMPFAKKLVRKLKLLRK